MSFSIGCLALVVTLFKIVFVCFAWICSDRRWEVGSVNFILKFDFHSYKFSCSLVTRK